LKLQGSRDDQRSPCRYRCAYGAVGFVMSSFGRARDGCRDVPPFDERSSILNHPVLSPRNEAIQESIESLHVLEKDAKKNVKVKQVADDESCNLHPIRPNLLPAETANLIGAERQESWLSGRIVLQTDLNSCEVFAE
jgi:hypothetical protein